MNKMGLHILLIFGHPRKDSYCAALADQYIRGAQDAQVQIRRLDLIDLEFEPQVLVPSPQKQFVEPDLVLAKELILWADHLVFVFPTWWGNVPALVKGFLDRCFVPGFAFREIQFDHYEKMLSPRTAQIITTMDTPVLVDQLFNGSPLKKSLINATLKFCGVSPVRMFKASPIKHSSLEQKEAWLKEAYALGISLNKGVLSPWDKFKKQINPWVKAIRLQFYPMTFFAYAIGAFAFIGTTGNINIPFFLLAYLLLFLLEVIVVFHNDFNDFETDKRNQSFSMFSGGSRVLVSGVLQKEQLRNAIKILLVFCAILTTLVSWLSVNSFVLNIGLILVFFLLAMSYTANPLKLSYRGLGEITVGFTHSFATILYAYVLFGGAITDTFPWLLGIPLFLAIVPAIMMAGIPDYEADMAVGKRTLAVQWGKTILARVAAVLVIAAVGSVFLIENLNGFRIEYGWPIYIGLLHGIYLSYLLFKFANKRDKPNRIDGIMAVALSYIMWFVLLPFFKLM
ncbi:hypothetical protein GCM10022216_15850 [Sphingobacterium kyonggiense]|uniref:Flavodoxin-like fold domain-containing protein n=2 Tax=Sphingobacterium kyonggiense TaxID=714075 RepID=A0ABP7YNZ7_9SPHI